MTRPAGLPRRRAWLFRGFTRYAVRFARKHFHAVRLSNSSAALPQPGFPVLVVTNHPGWWDPIIGTILSREFPEPARHYAAMDADMLAKYRLFGQMGVFGVKADSVSGAAAFLRTGGAILTDPHSVLWVTAQGRFADPRHRPLGLRPGVGVLAARLATGWILPVAFEYAYWNERTPEALIRVGPPIAITPGRTRDDWTTTIETALTVTLDALNCEAVARDPTAFRPLVSGEVGVGGWYDRFRRLAAWAGGRRFDPRHEAGPPP